MGFILIFIIVQIVVAGIVIFVLNIKLKKELVEAALENLHTNINSETRGEIIVLSASEIDPQLRGRIESIVKRRTSTASLRFATKPEIKSGLIIHIDTMVLDFSFANRLKKLTS